MGKTLGKSFQDRQRSASVRNLALDQIEEVLQKQTLAGEPVGKTYHQQLLIKLAGNVLPRLNEHTGDDGGDIKMNHTIKFVDAA